MATWLVTGANRGIGVELARQLHARGDAVIATCRASSPELDAVGCRVIDGVDLAAEDVGETLAAALGDEVPDVVVANAGILLGEPDGIDFDGARRQFEVNTLGPLRVTTALLPRLRPGAKLGFVSSMAGSIGDGPSGGTYGYRMSKAALNAAGVSLARDLAKRNIAVAILHPGYVKTEMTGNSGGIQPSDAAAQLWARSDGLTPQNTGTFWHANGQILPW